MRQEAHMDTGGWPDLARKSLLYNYARRTRRASTLCASAVGSAR